MSKTLRKRILGYTLSIALLNQLAPSCIEIIKSNITLPKTVTYNSNQHKLPKDFGTLEYLVYANSIAHSQSTDDEHCIEYSEKTFHAYQSLARSNNRKDLLDKIRFIAGDVKDYQGLSRHIWLQYKDKDNKIQNFETTIFMPKLSFEKAREVAENGTHFHKDIKKVYLRSFWGSYFKVPQKDLLLYRGGLAGLIYDEFIKK